VDVTVEKLNTFDGTLGLPGIVVTKRTKAGFAIAPRSGMSFCPYCQGVKLKPQNLYHRNLIDCVDIGDGEIVNLDFSFHRYKCLNPKCGRVFAPPMDFARSNGRVTYRLERLIFNLLIVGGYSFGQVKTEFLGNRLSRQSIYDIYHRYLDERIAENPNFLDQFISEHSWFDPAGYSRLAPYLSSNNGDKKPG